MCVCLVICNMYIVIYIYMLHMSAMDITHAIAICSSVSITFTSEAFHGPSKTGELPCRVLLPCMVAEPLTGADGHGPCSCDEAVGKQPGQR